MAIINESLNEVLKHINYHRDFCICLNNSISDMLDKKFEGGEITIIDLLNLCPSHIDEQLNNSSGL